ncbi:hypothetical protein FB465_3696 [Kitasatospora atroaurantiaca]|uniref:Uncharacterized protein n=1 Tax=Kitasatospora atroaurantiaca TaxID=285545 RepID=A0A561ESM5_9ACTN|nr:hypothetical protein [Kitasatospora atroaurantiaca]TWE18615.1 hypothetical protein FB465_3696 [Kitasatospora atroaurantiaca]
MNVSLPLTLVLVIVGWLIVRNLRLRWWVVTALVLLGFYLADSSAAPLIDKTTRDGVQVINQTGSK